MPADKVEGKRIIDSILGDMTKSSAGKQIVVGASMGWITGFVALKIGKFAAIIGGGGLLFLEIAQRRGYVRINWDRMCKDTNQYIEKIEDEMTGNEKSTMDKLEKYVDKKLDKVEEKLKSNAKKARKWYHSLISVGEKESCNIQECSLFIASFAAGVAVGLYSA